MSGTNLLAASGVVLATLVGTSIMLTPAAYAKGSPKQTLYLN